MAVVALAALHSIVANGGGEEGGAAKNLSQAQVTQLCAHFDSTLKDVLRQIQALDESLHNHGRLVETTRHDIANANAFSKVLEQDIGISKALLADLKVETRRTAEWAGHLQESCNVAHDGLAQLRTGLQLTNTNVQNVRDSFEFDHKEVQRVSREVDLTFRTDVAAVRESVQLLGVRVDRLTEDTKLHKAKIGEHSEGLQRTKQHASGIGEAMRRLDSRYAEQTEELNLLNEKLGAAQGSLEMTNGVVMKLFDDVAGVRSVHAELKDGVRSQGVQLDGLKQDVSKQGRDIFNHTERLTLMDATDGHLTHELGKANEAINNLRDGECRIGSELSALNRRLEELNAFATSTQEGLQAANALILPILGPGDGSAKSPSSPQPPSARSTPRGPPTGSPLKGGGMSGGPGSRRRPNSESAWHVRNIGLVPDRMSWM
eukprot:TRINITY_DN72635_c0_g1_i1.p1 TRINITY_DN72635_c0_g1~~TRINITY_DN72635_c0_g1_i1.p1  ORF type:complete len:478 (-),score=106.92 TRINITY_DN72635_c0_g1_i1:122-1414(-)